MAETTRKVVKRTFLPLDAQAMAELQAVLARHKNISDTARALKMDRSTLEGALKGRNINNTTRMKIRMALDAEKKGTVAAPPEKAPDEVAALREYMVIEGIDKAELSRRSGIPKATLYDVLTTGNNPTKMTLGRIAGFLAEKGVTAAARPHATEKASGGGKPSMVETGLLENFVLFGAGAKLVIPVMLAIANSDVGTRREFYARFGGRELDHIRLLARALSGEEMLQKVKRELGFSPGQPIELKGGQA